MYAVPLLLTVGAGIFDILIVIVAVSESKLSL